MTRILTLMTLIILFGLTQIESSDATVIQFNNDGSTTVFEAKDYLSKNRRVAKFNPPKMTLRKTNYDDLISKSAKKYKLDRNLIKAVIAAESSFRENAVSHAGAQGLMQLMPQTAKRFNVSDSFDPAQNIDGGSQYLKFLIKLFDDDLDLVLAAYNAGEGAVKKYGGIPPYPETINYVKKVKAYYSNN